MAIIIHDAAKKGGAIVRAQITSFKGSSHLDIREYYQASGEFRPTPKGVTIPLGSARGFVEALAAQSWE